MWSRENEWIVEMCFLTRFRIPPEFRNMVLWYFDNDTTCDPLTFASFFRHNQSGILMS